MIRLRPLLLLIPLIIVASCGPSKDPKNASFVVAQGKNIKITRAELNKERDSQLKGMGIPADKLTAEQAGFFEERILNMMLTRNIVLAAASSLKTPDISKQAEEQIAKIVTQFPSQDAFAQKLKENGLTTASFKKEIEDQLLAEHFIESKVDKNSVAVEQGEVEKFYKDHPEYWKLPELVKVRQISVRLTPEATKEEIAAKKKIIDDARARIAKGEKFEAVCGEVSEDIYKSRGGVCPELAKGQAPAEIEGAAFGQKVGVLGPVVKSSAGFHIIEVIAHSQPRVQTLDEVQGSISANLIGEKRRVAVNALIEDLRKKADVKINLPPAPKAPAEAASQPAAAPVAVPAPAPAAPAKK